MPQTPTTFPHGYALLIGVGTCQYAPWSLPVTVADVQAVASLLADPALCAYPDDQVRLLHDETATAEAILAGLGWLAERCGADPDATAVVLFSGHGWLDQSTQGYYLIPHDVAPFNLAGSALAAQDFTEGLRAVKARRLLVCVDSCHAQGMATAKGLPDLALPAHFVPTALPKGVVDGLKQGEGRAVFLSSRGDQKSWTRPDGSLSLFTHHLIEALAGAGNQPDDRDVRLSNVMNHLGRAVPASAAALGHAQTPFFDTATEDFPIALLHAGKGIPKGFDPSSPPAIRPSQLALNTGSGSIVLGDGAVAAGEGGVAVSGDVHGGIRIDNRGK